MSRLALFAVLYMTALLLELAERWRHPVAAPAALALVLVLLAVGVTRRTFLVYLALTTAYLLLAMFPDVANHVNIIIYCNLLVMAGLGWSLRHPERYPDDDAAYELLRPVLQTSMVLVYTLAGLAKLNTDFLNPAVSCVGDLVGDLAGMAGSRTLGLPTGLVILGAMVAALVLLLSQRVPRGRLVAGALLVLVVGAAALRLGRTLPPRAAGTIVVGMALVVILWEFVFGPLLAVPAAQAPILAFSWAMHATLALIGFVDFGALALTLLFTFVPREWADPIRTPVRLGRTGPMVQRVHLYFGLCLLAGAASALGRRLVAGVMFNLAAAVLLWPLYATVVGPMRPRWRGLPLSSPLTPGWLYLFPLLLLFHGLTSYLGLRTAGNFTMFSNLRTEGARSNHLFLGRNPLKLWHYQEDTVHVLAIDDGQAGIGYNYQPLQGNALPVVEFRKLIHQWTRAEATVPVTFEYRGTTYTTADVVHDPTWQTPRRDWGMRLLDFRVIQGAGPNRCRW